MDRISRRGGIVLGRVIAILLLLTTASNAAWIAIQNDSKDTVIVQEVVIVYGKPELGKPVTLAPNETLREYQGGAITKTYRVTEAVGKKHSESEVKIADKNVSCSVTVANGVPKLTVVKEK